MREPVRWKLPEGEVRCDFCNIQVKAKEDLQWYKTKEFLVQIGRAVVLYEAGWWGACSVCEKIIPVATDDRVLKMLTQCKRVNPLCFIEPLLVAWMGFFASVEDPTDSTTRKVNDPGNAWAQCGNILGIENATLEEKEGRMELRGNVRIRNS